MVDGMQFLDEEAAKLGVTFEGYLSKKARIKNGAGKSVSDILGWDCVVRTHDGACHRFYVAQPPLKGLTQWEPIECPLGVQIFSSYKIDIEQAIKILNSRDCGDTFTNIELYWPLVPDCKEPYWHFRLIFGNEVVIGANSGTGGCHKVKVPVK